MNRLQILQAIANKIDAKKYLEIGVEQGAVFSFINIPYKIGVDPDPTSAANIHSTSDNFFIDNTDFFDLIFIDGLHHADQVELDIQNSLNILNPNGHIVCHDMLPFTFEMQQVPRIQSEWTGDSWKAWVKLRSTRDDLDMSVVDIDYGCGIIKKGKQQLINIDCDINYMNFITNKYQWMNIISLKEFQQSLEK